MPLFESDPWSDDSEEEDQQNDRPPEGIAEEFENHALQAKHKLYEQTVLSPVIGEEKAQSNERLNDYLNHIHNVYVLALISQNGKKNARNLDGFPEGAQEGIHRLLEWLETFFSKNQIPDTIPYTWYIRMHFHDYPFVQNNSFMDQE